MSGPGFFPTLRPGLHSERQRENFRAGGLPFRFGGPGLPRCVATTREGLRCRGVTLTGHDKCRMHARRPMADARRLRLLAAVAHGEASPAAAERAGIRAAVNRLRSEWRRDPWAPGATLDLGEHEAAFRAALVEAGHSPRRLPPPVLDQLRWRWRRSFLDGQERPGLWGAALVSLPDKILAAGPPPLEWAPSDEPPAPGTAYTVSPPWPGSRRCLPDPRRRVPGGVLAPSPDTTPATMAPEDAARAALALALHRDRLAPALANVAAPEARLRVALAYARLTAGEIDHLAWIGAVEAAERA
jgi:hypothetical protein